MALMKWDPFADLNALHDQINTVFNQSFGHPGQSWQLAPITDVYSDDDKQLVVEVHLPNFKENEVSVDVHQGILEIRAEHHEKEEDKKKRKYVVRESASSFYRRVALPDKADEENIAARFEDGLLKVTVPYRELPQPKQITIEGGKTDKKS